MLDALKKRFFATQKEEVTMTKETVQPELTAEKVAESELAAHLENVTDINKAQAAKLAEALNSITELNSKLIIAQAELAEIESAKAALIAEAASKKLAARKEKVEMVIGTVKAASLLSATEALDDVAFDAVVTALAGSVEEESKGKMFKELGASGTTDASKVVEESAEMKALKAKYKAAK